MRQQSTFADRILAMTFVVVVIVVNFLAYLNAANDGLVQAALSIDSSVVGGFIALQVQRPRTPPE